MEFGSIIPVIIVFIIIVLQIRKRLVSSKLGTSKKSPGWKHKLDDFVSQVRHEIEAGTKENSNGQNDWERIESEYTEPVTISPSELDVEEKISLDKIDVLEDISTEVMSSDDSKKDKRPLDLSYDRKNLRKAVVWAEILAPPLALRDEQGDE